MLSLVRAHLTSPRIVVVDEASLGLSPLLVDQVTDALRQIVAGATALLLVEQYVTRAIDLADTASIMNRGQIVHSGAAAELQGKEVLERYSALRSAPDALARSASSAGGAPKSPCRTRGRGDPRAAALAQGRWSGVHLLPPGRFRGALAGGEGRAQRHGSIAHVGEKLLAFSPDRQYLTIYAGYDPGMMVRRHGHFSPHVVMCSRVR